MGGRQRGRVGCCWGEREESRGPGTEEREGEGCKCVSRGGFGDADGREG